LGLKRLQAYLQAVGLNPPDGLSSLLPFAGDGEGVARQPACCPNVAHLALLHKNIERLPAFLIPR
jgi:hypothetical protein